MIRFVKDGSKDLSANNGFPFIKILGNEYRTLNKNDFFVKENQPCNEVAFIASGIFRSYYSTSSAEDVTYCFRFPKGLRIQQSGINGCKKSNTSDKNMDKTHLISR
ncbi:cyclic nucleotide-binding domain-containing protein [Sphingobacterium corticibacterium]|uniref:Cyclic nucleotide-binding domain-containing protein n=1 Tax=Sphingobacterium corticibacterium TaxID=2484746 RepID=A0A4Q6XQP8_9SPHI|nr:hypothetical protein [Sphingobacterium corticibacterium]RZF62580.1 hypothetical protein EWE74_07235 [Sphingobacterium corticibacterium]